MQRICGFDTREPAHGLQRINCLSAKDASFVAEQAERVPEVIYFEADAYFEH